jgi:polysaccharide export outer membrane protein
VSVMLVKHAEQVVYVMGEVSAPGAKPYVPSMTTLHAIGSAGGPSKTGKTSSVVVLRRTGPDELEVYQVDIEAALDGKATARDFCLKPYDLVYVPRTFIANLNLFMDQYVRQNVIPFTAYIEGWRAFHASEIFWRQTGTP